ncbi:MAG: hypothetical protein SOH81_09090 [Acetobacter sp.]|jgi:hypothetical protein
MKNAKSLSSRGSLYLLFIIIGAGLSIQIGQDRFSDLRNYHLYNAWAFLTDRQGQDIFPADLQTFFNPLGDIPSYFLGAGILSHAPHLFAAVQGCWYGLFLIILWSITGILRQNGILPDTFTRIASFLIGATGAATISQVGLSSQEMPLAVLVLLALRLLLPLADAQTSPSFSRRILAAGLLVGLAAGIKPTAVIYGPAILAVTAVLAPARFSRKIQAAFICLSGCTIGFAITYGWWGWHLWKLTGNPTFPMFNSIFHSSLVPSWNFTDERYKPTTFIQWIFWPFFWLQHKGMIVTEPAFTDARGALAELAVLWLLVVTKKHLVPVQKKIFYSLLAFTITSYLVWQHLYSILRYAIPIEAMTGPLIVMACCTLFRSSEKKKYTSPRYILTGIAICLLIVTTRYPGWGHTHFVERTFSVQSIKTDPNSAVFLMGRDISYLAPYFEDARNTSFIGMNDMLAASRNLSPGQSVRQIIASGRPLYVIRKQHQENEHMELLQQFLPHASMTDCQTIYSNLEIKKHPKQEEKLFMCRISGDPVN